MSWLFPRGTRRMPPVWVDDVPDSVKVEVFDMLMKDVLKRPLRYIDVGGFNMHNNKEELLKDLIKRRANDELESDPLVTNPIWENEMSTEHIKNSVERKKQLMRLEKEMLVDMVFNLESRNEFLVHNLSEVEKMYNKLKEGEEIVKHGRLIDLPRAFDPSERPVKCSVCETVTSLYHGYEPKYCSNCGAKFDEEEKE